MRPKPPWYIPHRSRRGTCSMSSPEPLPQQTQSAEIDRECGEELYVIVVEPDRLRRLDEWLSHLTVWQLHLVTVPFALVIVGIAFWLNSLLPPVDPNLLFPGRPFGPLP
jgi:hypothetical protein